MTDKYGWVCSNCGDLNKHLELDLEFGKRRKTVECNSCKQSMPLKEQEEVFREKDVLEALKRQLERAQGSVYQARDDVETDRAQQREKMVHHMAHVLGLGDDLKSSEGMRKCIYCGHTNRSDADVCSSCGKKAWKGELLD